MPAADEFPRGWTTGTLATSGNGASVQIPAVAGVSHVITSVMAQLLNSSAVANSGNVQASIQDGSGIVNISLGWLPIGAVETVSELSWSGKVIGAVGSSLTLNWNTNCPAGCFMIVVIEGYDI